MIGMIIDAILFWFITVFVSQQHRLIWWEFLLWLVIAEVGSALIMFVSTSLGEVSSSLLGIAVMCGILYYALHYRFGVSSLKEKNMIIGIFFGFLIFINLVLGILFSFAI
ncbi:MAG: hypothetical protein P9L92_15820 [Candidatus Electryonea clarkiae]|nr:hypothetical protein [Candidatus Electryonea clarkiae]MDP8285778.1 hypothetical protein [Candidatus Electryonea clarkiae]